MATLLASPGPATALDVQDRRPDAAGGPITTVRQVASAIRACWQVPEGLRPLERLEVTVRFSLRRDGSAFPARRITFVTLPADGEARRRLAESALQAVADCTPIQLAPAFGASIAGRPLALRLTHLGPKGQGT